jgi:hypothetical protein
MWFHSKKCKRCAISFKAKGKQKLTNHAKTMSLVHELCAQLNHRPMSALTLVLSNQGCAVGPV